MPLAIYQHEEVTQRFERTLSRARLASTYLFVGPEGVGKRAFAHRLAAALLCHNRQGNSLDPCGACESCRLLDAGNHPDLLLVSRPQGKSTLPVSLFIGEGDKRNREGMCHDIALKPYLGRRRVAIIDDADSLSTESANCLLKTLEEPPPRSLLVLIGTSLSKQLPTIRSRCQVVRFGSLDESTVSRVLRERQLLEEGEDADALAQRSGGSVSAALAARDAAASQFQTDLLNQLLRPEFDPIRLASEINSFCGASGVEASVKRQRLGGLLSAVIAFCRNSLPGAGTLSQQTALASLDACIRAEEAVARNANQATLIQTWMVELWRARSAAQ